MRIIDSIKIDKSKTKSLYLQIADEIITLIDKGALKADDRLPSIRALSETLRVNNVTVVNAYKYLSNKKITYNVKGSGSYVFLKEKKLVDKTIELEEKENIDEMLKNIKIKDDSEVINFATATPKASLFPVEEFKSSINFVLERDMGEAFSYQETKGYYPLRDSLSQYLTKLDIDVQADSIQIISGAQQGLDIVAKSVLSHGDIVLVESPTYSGAIASFRSRGAKVVEIPIKIDGVDMVKLEELVKRYSPKLMYTMINCQNPTGYSYSEKNKKKLLEIASKYEMFILEDDYVGELMYSKQKSKPLKILDTEDIVIYIKSFSKIFMPGLRLGFMIVPPKIDYIIQNAKQATDISTSGLIQRAFDIYLRRNHWQKQLDDMKDIYKKRYDAMVKSLNEYMPRKIDFYIPRGGILFWIELPKNVDSRKFCEFVSDSKILLVPGDLFYYSGDKSRGIRLSIASVTVDEIENGIKLLSIYLKKYLNNIDTSSEII